MKTTDSENVTGAEQQPPSAVACSAWLECSDKLRKMSHEHKARHEVANEQWERAYHLGAAMALQDARFEVLSTILVTFAAARRDIAMKDHSNGGDERPPEQPRP